jgi:excinuclease ABC subunit C
MTMVRESVAQLPNEPGVYRFRDARGRALYIGRAQELRHRVASYWGDLGERSHLARMVERIAGVEAVACDSAHEAAWLERNLLERAKPYWNRTRGGQEVPVYVRLQARAGPKIIHMGEVEGDFGPYLGGFRVRTALAAIDRLLPVTYTRPGATGSEREMARVRGIDRSKDAQMHALLRRILERDPQVCTALLAELTRRRDAAAADLSFEVAARLQREIGAVDWLLSPQRVTRRDQGRHQLLGWADGVLVAFQVRDGLVNEWTVRDSPEPPVGLEQTPLEWAGFLAAAAALAARLRHASGTRGLGSRPEIGAPGKR